MSENELPRVGHEVVLVELVTNVVLCNLRQTIQHWPLVTLFLRYHTMNCYKICLSNDITRWIVTKYVCQMISHDELFWNMSVKWYHTMNCYEICLSNDITQGIVTKYVCQMISHKELLRNMSVKWYHTKNCYEICLSNDITQGIVTKYVCQMISHKELLQNTSVKLIFWRLKNKQLTEVVFFWEIIKLFTCFPTSLRAAQWQSTNCHCPTTWTAFHECCPSSPENFIPGL